MVLSLLPIAGTAAAGAAEGFIAEDRLSQSFPSSASPRIVVETFNGDITVSVGMPRTVAAEVSKHGFGDSPEAALADLDAVQVTMEKQGNTIRIVARRAAPGPAGESGASVDLRVPVGAALDLLTSNGDTAATGVAGSIKAVSAKGGIEITGAKGRLNLRTTNGPIRIEATGAAVTASTSNGRIDFAGTLADGSHTFKTLNGPIDLTLPPDARFQINASSWNGKVTSGFRLAQGGTRSDLALYGKVGGDPAGTPPVAISAEAINGDVTLQPRK